MARSFDIPTSYRSPLVGQIKSARKVADTKKKDLSPTVLDLGRVQFKLARHFGFCYGVENAIETAYRAVKENSSRRIFLLSEMIHNPHVNNDLIEKGVKFLQKPSGEQLIPFEALTPEDIVIVPAFGTTVELFAKLQAQGVNPQLYDATCPFVEKVWKRAEQLGEKGYTVIIHGKHSHEETRATFSHAKLTAPSIVILDMEEAKDLADYISGEKDLGDFHTRFKGRTSEGFDAKKHLERIGVVNQTTMLATETQAITDALREGMRRKVGIERLSYHCADTRDTLCYATNENQDATYALIESGGDLALVVGGYNSSNTSHLVELLERKFPTYHVKDAEEILSDHNIRHLQHGKGEVVETTNWLPLAKQPLTILVTAGASCPDTMVEKVLRKVTEVLKVEEGKLLSVVKEATDLILR